MENMEERKAREIRFHDDLYDQNLSDATASGHLDFYSDGLVGNLRAKALDYLGPMKGKRILFFGCGLQWSMAEGFWSSGADVSMIDISGSAVMFMEEKIRKEKREERMRAVQMDCEELEFDAKAFDLVFGNAIIHHLNIAKAARELSRVMSPEARAAFIEPLGMNPFINLYRRMTPQLRTPDEHPLTHSDFKLLSEHFSRCDHEEFTLFALAPVVFNAVMARFGRSGISMGGTAAVDDFVLKKMPLLRRYCWNTVIKLEK